MPQPSRVSVAAVPDNCPGPDHCPAVAAARDGGVDPTIALFLKAITDQSKASSVERAQATKQTVEAIGHLGEEFRKALTEQSKTIGADVRSATRANTLVTLTALVLMSGLVTGVAYLRGWGVEVGTGDHHAASAHTDVQHATPETTP